MAPTYSKFGTHQLGSAAPDFTLLGVDDQTYRLNDFLDKRALVVVFMCNHCPYVIAMQGRINQLARETSPRGVQWIGINSNDAVKYPDDSFEMMKVRAKEQAYHFPYLHDESQNVAKKFDAACTPEFFAYSNENGRFVLRYKGRFDDNWKDASAVTQQDLKTALEAILAGKNPDSDQKPALGCSIKWK